MAGEHLGAGSVSLAQSVDGAYSPIAATDDLATLLDDEQFALGDGPTFHAASSPAPVIVDDLRQHQAAQRWPVFAKLAQRHQIQSVYAFPLRIGDGRLGVLSAYRAEPGAPDAGQYADGLILASLGAVELIGRAAGAPTESDPGFVEPGIYDRSALQVAAGMVAESLNISIVAALVRIRARAFADDQPLSQTAQRIVARQLVLEI